MDANLFLIILGFIWIIAAVIQDMRKREVENWINFSLIIFALTYRLFYSLFSSSWGFFIQGIIGLLIFLILGNIFYYSRIFAGGDAKLFIALGAIIPFSLIFKENLYIFVAFIIGFLIFGGIYGFVYSLFILIKNKKEFLRLFKQEIKSKRNLFVISFIFALILLIFPLFSQIKITLFLPLIFFLFPLMYIYAKAIEECMSVEVNVKRLTEGDWLYQNVKIKNQLIKSSWDGLTREDIKLLKKYKNKVKIKQGIPFTPSFLFAFIFILYLWYSSREFIQFWL
jgi:Flp pilus assembly protein protease CpaA